MNIFCKLSGIKKTSKKKIPQNQTKQQQKKKPTKKKKKPHRKNYQDYMYFLIDMYMLITVLAFWKVTSKLDIPRDGKKSIGQFCF